MLSDTAPASAAGRRNQSGPAAVGARKVPAPSCRGRPGPGRVPTAEPPRCPRRDQRRPAGAVPRDPPHLGPERRPSTAPPGAAPEPPAMPPGPPGTAPGLPGAAPGPPVPARRQPGPGRLPAAAGIGAAWVRRGGSLRPRGTKTVRNVGPQSPGRAGERGRCHRGERRLEDPPAPLSPSLGLLCGVGPSRRFLGRGLPSPSSPGSLSCVRGWRKALGASRPKPKLPVASSCFPFGKC